MIALNPLLFVVDLTELLGARVKMKQHSVALHSFVRMLVRDASVEYYTLNIAISCFCYLNRVDFAFAVSHSLVKRGLRPDVVTFSILIKGYFLEGIVHEIVEAENMRV